MSGDSSIGAAASIAESSYGVAKRLAVIRSWVDAVCERTGRPSLNVLDVGCGTGDQITAPLARAGHTVLGVDMHPPSIAAASARHDVPSLTFRVARTKDLVREGRHFDVVICSEVLEHVTEPAELLKELRSLVAVEGALVITAPNGYGAYEWLCSLQRLLQRLGIHQSLRWTVWKGRRVMARLRGRPVPQRPLEYLTSDEAPGFLNIDSGHVQFFAERRLEELFAEAGFAVADRRARTLLCGPYVDVAFVLWPWPDTLYRWNNRAADVLPFRTAADWMFLLVPAGS